MKLQSVKYIEGNNNWYSVEYIPDNKREILLYVLEFGTTSGYFDRDKWYSLRYNCEVIPLTWREMPRYESKNSL
jgi:hypothetical protein